MQKFSPIKQGDSFYFYINMTDESVPLTGQSSNLKSQIRTANDVLISELSIVETQTPGEYYFSSLSTATWPIGNLFLDIQYTNNGTIESSETIAIIVVKDVSR